MSRFVRFLLRVAVGVGLIQPLAATAQESSHPDERAVLNLENQFVESRVTGNTSVIRSGFASDGVFIHENGDERTRSALEAEVALGSYWLGFDRVEGVIHVYGDAAVTHAVLNIKLGGGQIDRVRTTGVYAKQAGTWRIVSWQSTLLISPVAPPSRP